MGKFRDLLGMKFGRLLVIEFAGMDKRGASTWKCVCDCGSERIVAGGGLTSGNSKSCGCIATERISKINKGPDLSGKKFNRLTVIEESRVDKHRHHIWRCVCDCGKETLVDRGSLVTGHIKSCGCLGYDRKYRKFPKDLSSVKFGRLTPLYDTGKLSGISHIWHCKCDCGVEKDISRSNLASGSTVSCGCHAKEMARNNKTHGMAGTKEYKRAIERIRNERKRNLDSEWTVCMEIEIHHLFKECVLCGSQYKLAVDHVDPLALGNGIKPGNAVILCLNCNSQKQKIPMDRLPEDKRNVIREAADNFANYWESVKDKYDGISHGRPANRKFREIHAGAVIQDLQK